MSSTSIYALLQHPNVKTSLAERYIKFIESCTCDEAEYHEYHHVLPASVYQAFSNLSKNRWNGKSLSARQHFIAHCMLARMFNKNTPEFFSMVKAFNMMGSSSIQHGENRYINSRLYEQNRKYLSETMKTLQRGITNNRYGTCWVTSPDLSIVKTIPRTLINEFYEQGWFISRSKQPYKYVNPTCNRCGDQFISKYTTTKLCPQCHYSVKIQCCNNNKRAVIDENGIIYDSLMDAGIAKSVTSEAIRYRIKIGKYKYMDGRG